MVNIETLKTEIEQERRKLDSLLETQSLEDVLAQSRRVDGLLEEYIHLTSK